MRRNIIRIVLFLVFVGVAVGLGFWTRKYQSTEHDVRPKYENGKIRIPTAGNDVYINDVYANPVALLPLNGVVFAETNQYSMYYYPFDQSFAITLFDSDLSTAQEIAERVFLENLGIDARHACKLKATISVPFAVNENVAGPQYGLSFCGGGHRF